MTMCDGTVASVERHGGFAEVRCDDGAWCYVEWRYSQPELGAESDSTAVRVEYGTREACMALLEQYVPTATVGIEAFVSLLAARGLAVDPRDPDIDHYEDGSWEVQLSPEISVRCDVPEGEYHIAWWAPCRCPDNCNGITLVVLHTTRDVHDIVRRVTGG